NILQRLGKGLRREPSERWFAHIGSIGRDGGEVFRIGTETTYSPSSSGDLYAFANDASFAYWNNRGSVRLSFTVSGGALRSAIWTGVVLNAIRDKLTGKEVNFDDHVRLILGASGGMLGAASYVSMIHNRLIGRTAAARRPML